MLARLILALLMAAFALPALANGPCHDAPMVAAAMHHASRGAPDDRATVAHVCIGCIPPASLAALTPAAPTGGPAMPYRAVTATLVRRTGMPPALPPPRRDA